MTLRYPPTIKIGSYTIASAWDGLSLLALASIKITWGRRNDIYEDVEPASAEITILDVDGSWATDNQLQGESVIIGRTGPTRTMFRGRITDAKSQYVTISDPAGKIPSRRVWLVTLSARDKLADLAQARPIGYAAFDGDGSPTTWWRPTTAAGRVADVLGKGGSSIVSSIAVPNLPVILGVGASAAADTQYIERYYPDRPSLLRLLQDVYFGVPLGHVNYNADSDGIEVGTSASSGGMALILSGGIVKTSPIAGYTIDSSKVIAPREPTIRSTVAAGVDLVQISYIHTENSGPVSTRVAELPTDRAATSGSLRTLIIDTHFRDYFAGLGSYGDEYAALEEVSA